MMQETKTHEQRELKPSDSKGFENVKPEGKSSLKENRNFWDSRNPMDTKTIESYETETHKTEKMMDGIRETVIGETDEEKHHKDSSQNKKDRVQNNIIEAVRNGSITLESTQEKGNFGEICMDQAMERQGFKRISRDPVTSLDSPPRQGIDGVYRNAEGKYAIVDAKFGTAKLEITQFGKQMDREWIDDRLDAAVGKAEANSIRRSWIKNPDDALAYVARVDETGKVSFEKLDKYANTIMKGLETIR